jgi:hypothetical protein
VVDRGVDARLRHAGAHRLEHGGAGRVGGVGREPEGCGGEQQGEVSFRGQARVFRGCG